MKYIYNLFILSMIMLSVVSCGDSEEEEQLSLSLQESGLNFNAEDRCILLSLSGGDDKVEATFTIHGGDGKYSLDTDNQWSAIVKSSGDKFTVTPVRQGSTVVTVRDRSHNVYSLTVDVVPVKQTFICNAYSYRVEGESLTKAEKEQLEDEIRAAIPKNRTYLFTYTGKDKGEVEISSETERTQKGTFTIQDVSDYRYMNFHLLIQLDNEKSLMYEYNHGIPTGSFGENVTERYKERFPNLQSATAMQCGYFQLEEE